MLSINHTICANSSSAVRHSYQLWWWEPSPNPSPRCQPKASLARRPLRACSPRPARFSLLWDVRPHLPIWPHLLCFHWPSSHCWASPCSKAFFVPTAASALNAFLDLGVAESASFSSLKALSQPPANVLPLPPPFSFNFSTEFTTLKLSPVLFLLLTCSLISSLLKLRSPKADKYIYPVSYALCLIQDEQVVGARSIFVTRVLKIVMKHFIALYPKE